MDVSVRPVSRRRTMGAALLIAIALLAAEAAIGSPGWMSVAGSPSEVPEVAGARKVGLEPGNYAPDFVLPSVDGKVISLSQFRGKRPVLLNLWSVPCPSCHLELDELKAMYPDYRDRLEILSVSVDSWYPPSVIERLVSDKGLPFTVLVDQKSTVATSYRVSFVPVNYLVDERGVILRVLIGAIDKESMKKEVDPLLE